MFSRCVVGYRAWDVDGQDRLWPIGDRRAPWVPGINTARCNRGGTTSLQLQWSLLDGRRVLESAPAHRAPLRDCECGLYAWRRPHWRWYNDPPSPSRVLGAVACWGALEVHDTGFRAEHACVVSLARPGSADAATRLTLQRIAERYGVELVPLDQLEQAAAKHGAPLPDETRPPSVDTRQEAVQSHDADSDAAVEPIESAPDATIEEVGVAVSVGPDGRPRAPASWTFGGGGGSC